MPHKRSTMFKKSTAIITLLLPAMIYASDPPELDFIGGYFDDGKYKCYAEPCFSIHANTPQGSSSTEFDKRGWPHWLDIDQNCQKEHNQLLANKSLVPVTYKDDNMCKEIISGEWKDAYSGEIVSDINEVIVDHRVSLKEAHSLRGLSWSIKKRALFANTPDNLVVVSAASKDERNGRNASEWMPKNERYWCDYVVHREKMARLYELGFQDAVLAFHKKVKRTHCKY